MDLNNFMTNYGSIIFFVVLIVAMYFLMIRPQKKREKEFKDMLGSLKVGDKIVTIGGVVGEIVSIDEKELTLKTADGVNIVFIRDAVARVMTDDNANAK